MQTIATRVFIVSSVLFGAIGSLFFITLRNGGGDTNETIFTFWGITGCVVLSSFALSVAGKYLSNNSADVGR